MSAGPGRLPLHAVEWAALGMLTAVLGVTAVAGLAPGWQAVFGTGRAAATVLPVALVVGVGLQAGWRLVARRDPRGYLGRVARIGWLVLWLRLWLAIMVTSFAYFWLKLCVPLLHERSFDATLWKVDRWLHLGLVPVSAAQAALPPSLLVTGLDYWYALWLPTVVVGIAFFGASDDASVRRGSVLSCILLWSFGAWIYLALPVVGPAYVFPGFFDGLPEAMPLAAVTQSRLWANYQTVVEGGAVALATVDPTRGVAALPSLHVAFHVLFVLWARRHGRLLMAGFAIASGVTAVGAVRTGWHYAADAYLGAVLAVLAYGIATRVEVRRARAAGPPP